LVLILGLVVIVVLAAVILFVQFIPVIVAFRRRHRLKLAILGVSVLFLVAAVAMYETIYVPLLDVIAWIACLVWAFSENVEDEDEPVVYRGPGLYPPSDYSAPGFRPSSRPGPGSLLEKGQDLPPEGQYPQRPSQFAPVPGNAPSAGVPPPEGDPNKTPGKR
jgi:hypothetical protein